MGDISNMEATAEFAIQDMSITISSLAFRIGIDYMLEKILGKDSKTMA